MVSDLNMEGGEDTVLFLVILALLAGQMPGYAKGQEKGHTVPL